MVGGGGRGDGRKVCIVGGDSIDVRWDGGCGDKGGGDDAEVGYYDDVVVEFERNENNNMPVEEEEPAEWCPRRQDRRSGRGEPDPDRVTGASIPRDGTE